VEKMSALPGVTAAGAVDLPPLGDCMLTGPISLDSGGRLPSDYTVDKPCVSPNYFQAMGIRLLSGRDFTARDDLPAAAMAIVSESVARKVWPGDSPIGKRLSLDERGKPKAWLTVVGVVEDVRQYALTSGPGRAVYRPYAQVSGPTFNTEVTFVARTTLDPAFLIPSLRHAVHEVDATQPVKSVATMQDRVRVTMAEPLFETRLLTAFSLMALLLAAIGTYGVVAYSVAARTREIGIRMALGAASGDVMREVLRRTATLAAAGVALGTAGAFAATRVLTKLVFELKPADPATFVAVATLLAAVALVAAWIPAQRATRVDPVAALRYE
jgi:putative ABC transport system permease protein